MTGVDVGHTKAQLEDLRRMMATVRMHGISLGPHVAESLLAKADALVAEVESLREKVRRDEPTEPAEYIGFDGCTNHNPDICACGTYTDEECSICGEVMEAGEMFQMAFRAVIPGLPEHHPDQEWEHSIWHADCAAKAQAEADEAQKKFDEWLGGDGDLF